MNWCINFLKFYIILILITPAWAMQRIDWQLCRYDNTCVAWEKVKSHYLNNLTYPIEKRITLRANINCSKQDSHQGIYLGSVKDSFSLKLNGKFIQHWNELYLAHEPALVQVPTILCRHKNLLELNIYDLNGAIIGLSDDSYIGQYSILYWKAKSNYFFTTGITVMGAYLLFHIAALILLLMIIKFHPRLLALFFYTCFSTLYLVSFSEVPRSMYKPELLSGIIHFTLLMLQGCSFVVLLKTFFAKKDYSWLFNSIIILYLIFVFIFVHNYCAGLISYHRQIITVLYSAPLVLAPSIYALSIMINRFTFDRAFILSFSWMLFFCQLNDLMVFWKVYPGFFTLKFYIPITTILFAIQHFKMASRSDREIEILAAKAKSVFHVIHDLKIPLDLLQTLISYGPTSLQNFFPMLENSVQRLKELSFDLLDQTKKPEKFDLALILRQLVDEQKIAYRVNDHNMQLSLPQKLIFTGHINSIKRTISNILRNAIEATLPLNEKIIIQLRDVGDEITLVIFNGGAVVDSTILQNIEDGLRIQSHKGHGLGLQQVLSCCKIFGWKFSLGKAGNGTQAILVVPRV